MMVEQLASVGICMYFLVRAYRSKLKAILPVTA